MPKSHTERPDTQVTPDPALEKRTRRQLTPEYKLRIIAAADACKRGELGEIEAGFSRIEVYGGRMDARQMAQIGQD